jgi:IS605 OrfB family transposase
LDRQARAVNFVWNYCNQTQREAVKRDRPWLSAYDLQKLTASTSGELDLHAHTIQRICTQFVASRTLHKRPWLRFRGRKSLGWVPFNTGHITFRKGAFIFRGSRYSVWLSRIVPPKARFGAGSFCQDARGRWYLNVPIDVEPIAVANNATLGIDLGLKDLATCSNGEKIAMPRFYRRSEAALASAQRANKSKRVAQIHRKIAHRRRDFSHKASTTLAKHFALIFVGNVSASQFAKTNHAKSVLDAGWSDFKRMLSYKTMRYGGRTIEVSEAYTTQTCSNCDSRGSHSRPRGIAGLGIREWTCDACGTRHDRDENAARNILRLGLQSLAGGAPA